MAQLNTSKEIQVNVDELQRQSSINCHVRFGEDLQTRKESAPCDYMCPSAFAILCCLPLGMCALWAANSALKSWARGDYEKAKVKNNIALWLIVAAFLSGSAVAFIVVITRLK
ncbi:synapse differentiation-inducing gene protein 1-like isoform X6 [Mytilus californianus]|uniref:synapse differentiation-inducing gene protein 1-like isoform X6 n=1 Tax=Mytilus californianus TaxID=6549 RepID=UPI002245A122|nr:synapse differentiation-inducing gene protein 1-like isoform X6 [Mytilus californianus]